MKIAVPETNRIMIADMDSSGMETVRTASFTPDGGEITHSTEHTTASAARIDRMDGGKADAAEKIK